MTRPDGPAGTSRAAGASRWSWLLPVGTFLAGCALGGVVVGVGATVDDDEPSAPTVAADADPDAGAEPDGEADDAPGSGDDTGSSAAVPESCVQTADDATTLVERVDEVVAAIADLEPERLRQTVDDVQQVRDEVEDVADQCRAAAQERLQDADTDDAVTPAS